METSAEKTFDINSAQVYVTTREKKINTKSKSAKGEWLLLADYIDKDDFLDACKEIHKDECTCPICGGKLRFVHDLDTNNDYYECKEKYCDWSGSLDEADCEAEFLFTEWNNIPEGLINEEHIDEDIWELMSGDL